MKSNYLSISLLILFVDVCNGQDIYEYIYDKFRNYTKKYYTGQKYEEECSPILANYKNDLYGVIDKAFKSMQETSENLLEKAAIIAGLELLYIPNIYPNCTLIDVLENVLKDLGIALDFGTMK